MKSRLRTMALAAMVVVATAGCLPARAAGHPKLDQALTVLAKAANLNGKSDDSTSQIISLVGQAISLIQSETPGPEWQGHRAAAVDLLQGVLTNAEKGQIRIGKIRTAMGEIQADILEADDYQPASVVLSPGSPAITPAPGGPDFIKLTFLSQSGAEPAAPGATFGKVQVPATNDPNSVILGTPAYFNLGSGKTVIYSVESGKPLTNLVYTGRAFEDMTLEIEDPQGRNITGIGPIDGGNVDRTLEIPLPGLTQFRMVITDYSSSWILINNLRFEANGIAQMPSNAPAVPGAPAPAPASGPLTPPPPAVVSNKLTADEARAVVLIAGDNAEGTGFMIKTADGPAVVTNLHVIANNPNLKITTDTGALVPVLSMKGASDRDLALLAIKDAGYHYLQMAPDVSALVQPGDEVVTPGNSEGGEVMLNTTGKVLGIGPERIEFDNPIYHGNSGGPVFQTKSGKVLGVVTEAQKVDTTDALDKASFANRNSAISSSMRYFGLRLDTVPAWLPIDPHRFQIESAFLDNFDQRNHALDSYLNAPDDSKPEDTLWQKDPKIMDATNEYFQQAAGADVSQRMDAERILWSEFNDIAAIDMTAIRNPDNFYPFDRQRAQDEAAYRKALQNELNAINADVSRLRSLPRANSP